MLEYAASGAADGGMRDLARRFEGAWPYLELIAGCNGIDDPLDARVVEAYWIGNRLLERVSAFALGTSATERFRGPAGRAFEWLAESIGAGARAHHDFHVLGVYPFVGLLRSGKTERPLHVLDRCRVRWGQVVDTLDQGVLVRSRPLVWDGRELRLGVARVEPAVAAHDGLGFVEDLGPGDWVALHWDWVCERLEPRQLRHLRGYTASQLRVVNHGAAHPAPSHLLA